MTSLNSMPVGYRFRPTDKELINHYLKLKNQGSERYVSNIREIDVLKWEPWDLPGHLGSESDDQEWYFFSRRNFKYSKSTRSDRATEAGFWKPTGKDRKIKTGSTKVIGTKKTLVFHKRRAQKAVRTCWVMHQYLASADEHNPQAFVLYLLKKKTDDSVEILNTDGAELNISSPSALSLKNAPLYSPSTPTVHQGSANFSSSDQSRLAQNWKEQEVSSHALGYPDDSGYEDDDIDFESWNERFFNGQQPTWEDIDRILPAIPLPDVYPNQGPIHMTAEFQFEMQFGEDAVHGGSSYLSDSESSYQESYNDMILARVISLSGNSEIIQHVQLKTVSDDSSVEPLYEAKSSRNLKVADDKSSGVQGRNSDNVGFIVYAENPRVCNGTALPSNYILNIAIGIFLTVVITGEVLFGLVS